MLRRGFLSASSGAKNVGVKNLAFSPKHYPDIHSSKFFGVVSNVDEYSNFVPFVKASSTLDEAAALNVRGSLVNGRASSKLAPILDRGDLKRFKKEFQAELAVGYGGSESGSSVFTDRYTSLVTCTKTTLSGHTGGVDDILEYSVHAQDLRDSAIFEGLGSIWTIRPTQGGQGW
mmetsp:Transcript_16122/g.32103  ORF Transcript_16122/g.32103 Transcript_16122/m.32103 type:complete len:174 (+) Transcript_16122:153-674(+)